MEAGGNPHSASHENLESERQIIWRRISRELVDLSLSLIPFKKQHSGKNRMVGGVAWGRSGKKRGPCFFFFCPDADDGRVQHGHLGCVEKCAVDRKTLPISSSTTLTEPRSSSAMVGGPVACMRTDPIQNRNRLVSCGGQDVGGMRRLSRGKEKLDRCW